MLVGLLRRTVAAQVCQLGGKQYPIYPVEFKSNRVMWMYLNKQEKINYAQLENECFQRLRSLPIRQRVEDDNNWVKIMQ
jgi:hypothetical protein